MNQKFKQLKLLEFILREKPQTISDPSTVAIISIQHLLDTTGSLFECLLRIGIPASQTLVMGKLYSNNSLVAEKLREMGIEVSGNSDSNTPGSYHTLFTQDCLVLWKRFEEKISNSPVRTIIVLDDGGSLISSVPKNILKEYCVIGVEQTTSGIELNKESLISIINVAGSAVKKFIEPSFISQAVIQKVKRYLLNYRPGNIGIIGCGNIGKALIRDLSDYYKLTVFDIQRDKVAFPNSNIHAALSLEELFSASDFIIGATGKDISSADWIGKLNCNKIMMSVSSGDIEFRTLLKEARYLLKKPVKSLLDDVEIEASNTLTILRGGTPINFDNNIHSVLPEYIQLTRGLLLIGVIQAIDNQIRFCKNRNIIKLDPVWQNILLAEWVKMVHTEGYEFTVPLKKILQEEMFINNTSAGC